MSQATDADSYESSAWEASLAEDRRLTPMLVILVPFLISAVALTLTSLSTAVWALGVICAVAFAIALLRAQASLPPEWICLCLFTGWALLGGVNAISSELFWEKILQLVQFTVLVAILSHYAWNTRMFRILAGAIIVGTLILSASVILTGEYALAEEGQARVAGLARNSNIFAISLVYASAFLFYFLRIWQRMIAKALALCLLIVLVALLVASGSRTGFFTFVFFMGAWFVLVYGTQIRNNPGVFLGGALAVTILAVILAVTVSGSLLARRMTVITSERSDVARSSSGVTRIALAKQGLKLLLDHPIVGVGAENFVLSTPYRLYAHNNYVEVFASTGVPGGLLYHAIPVLLILRLRRLRRLCQDSPDDVAAVRLAQAIVFALLLASVGRVWWTQKPEWSVLGIVIGWSFNRERALAAAWRPNDDANGPMTLEAYDYAHAH